MKRAVKWMFIIVGGLLVLTIVALLLIPRFVDVQKYRAEIENWASEIAGVPVSIGGDLRLSIIPWLGVAVSDVQIGNPEGFQEKQPTGKGGEGLPIKALAVGELTLKDGLILWIDQSKGERREVSERYQSFSRVKALDEFTLSRRLS